MNLEQKVMDGMKEAMKARNEASLRSYRAIKAEIIKAKTEPGAGGEINADAELRLLQKMVKQRKDALDIYKQQNREDLALIEQQELDIISTFLPAQMSQDDLKKELQEIIIETGASSLGDMGKVMSIATKKLAGKAEGKAISAAVKELLGK